MTGWGAGEGTAGAAVGGEPGAGVVGGPGPGWGAGSLNSIAGGNEGLSSERAPTSTASVTAAAATTAATAAPALVMEGQVSRSNMTWR